MVERWRMGVAVGTLSVHGGGRLVVSGHAGEAARLVALAPPDADISIEPTARSTFENVQRSLPFLLGAEQVAVASDRFHQRRALRYFRTLEPNVATCVIAAEYDWRDGWWMDVGGAVYELLLRVRSAAMQLGTRRHIR